MTVDSCLVTSPTKGSCWWLMVTTIVTLHVANNGRDLLEPPCMFFSLFLIFSFSLCPQFSIWISQSQMVSHNLICRCLKKNEIILQRQKKKWKTGYYQFGIISNFGGQSHKFPRIILISCICLILENQLVKIFGIEFANRLVSMTIINTKERSRSIEIKMWSIFHSCTPFLHGR